MMDYTWIVYGAAIGFAIGVPVAFLFPHVEWLAEFYQAFVDEDE